MVIAGYIRSAAPCSRCCEADLESSAVILNAPVAEHAARNLPGLDFMFTITNWDRLDEPPRRARNVPRTATER
jgi:hypothetical protein